jgi:hypothetical protein
MKVLAQPAIAHLAGHPLDDPDRAFGPGPHFGLGAVFRPRGGIPSSGGFGDDPDDGRPSFEHSFNPADAAIVVCDEDPTASLIERTRIERSTIGAITEQGLGEEILAGLSTKAGLLDHLREKGITPDQLRATASKVRKQERKRGQIASPSASDPVLSDAVKSAIPLVRVSRILERLADELASGLGARRLSSNPKSSPACGAHRMLTGHLHCECFLCPRLGNRCVPELLRILRSFEGAERSRNPRAAQDDVVTLAAECAKTFRSVTRFTLCSFGSVLN